MQIASQLARYLRTFVLPEVLPEVLYCTRTTLYFRTFVTSMVTRRTSGSMYKYKYAYCTRTMQHLSRSILSLQALRTRTSFRASGIINMYSVVHVHVCSLQHYQCSITQTVHVHYIDKTLILLLKNQGHYCTRTGMKVPALALPQLARLATQLPSEVARQASYVRSQLHNLLLEVTHKLLLWLRRYGQLQYVVALLEVSEWCLSSTLHVHVYTYRRSTKVLSKVFFIKAHVVLHVIRDFREIFGTQTASTSYIPRKGSGRLSFSRMMARGCVPSLSVRVFYSRIRRQIHQLYTYMYMYVYCTRSARFFVGFFKRFLVDDYNTTRSCTT